MGIAIGTSDFAPRLKDAFEVVEQVEFDQSRPHPGWAVLNSKLGFKYLCDTRERAEELATRLQACWVGNYLGFGLHICSGHKCDDVSHHIGGKEH